MLDTENHAIRCEVCHNKPATTLRRWAGEWLCEECFIDRAPQQDDGRLVLQMHSADD